MRSDAAEDEQKCMWLYNGRKWRDVIGLYDPISYSMQIIEAQASCQRHNKGNG